MYSSFHIAADEECVTASSELSNNDLLAEMRSSQDENFAHLEGVLAGSFLGLQKALADLMIPLSHLSQDILKRPHPGSDSVSSDCAGPVAKASKASASSKYPSAIAKGNTNKHAITANASNNSKRAPTHRATRQDNAPKSDLDYDECMSGAYSGDNDEMYSPNSDSVRIPDQDTLDADVHALLNDQPHNKDTDSMLTQIPEGLLCEADTTDAVNDKLASIILGLWGQKLTSEKVKARLNKFLRLNNCELFVPKYNKDIWSDRIDTRA